MMYLIHEGRVGEYVRYDVGRKIFRIKPAELGYRKMQYVNTAKTKMWRIYRKEGDVLEIISDEPVAVVSAYGIRGFAQIIYMANIIANQFVDNKCAFSARSIGCSEESKGIEEFRFNTNGFTSKHAWDNNSSESFYLSQALRDEVHNIFSEPFYLTDFNRINRYKLLTRSDTPILLAARKVENSGKKTCYCIHTMDNNGRYIEPILFSKNRLRPFREVEVGVGVSLHSKVLFSNGDGTFKKPYELARI